MPFPNSKFRKFSVGIGILRGGKCEVAEVSCRIGGIAGEDFPIYLDLIRDRPTEWFDVKRKDKRELFYFCSSGVDLIYVFRRV